jgi:hypothetical protein
MITAEVEEKRREMQMIMILKIKQWSRDDSRVFLTLIADPIIPNHQDHHEAVSSLPIKHSRACETVKNYFLHDSLVV